MLGKLEHVEETKVTKTDKLHTGALTTQDVTVITIKPPCSLAVARLAVLFLPQLLKRPLFF